MKQKTFVLRLILLALSALLLLPVIATAEPGDEETVVTVRKDCSSASNNCFETVTEATNWVFTTGQPSASKKFLIDLGPGTWNENWTCMESGHVTLRGAGRESTILAGSGSGTATMHITDCVDVEFMDMTITSPNWGVIWSKEGNSTWTDVDIIGTTGGTASSAHLNAAWMEDYCYEASVMTELPVHYFFGSRLIVHNKGQSRPTAAYYGACSDVWFYGGEITYISDEASQVLGDAALVVSANTKFRAYGSLIQAVSKQTLRGSLVAVEVSDRDIGSGEFPGQAPGMFHMHGGIINVTVAPDSTLFRSPDATALWVRGAGARAHTLDTAYVMNTPDTLPSYRLYTEPGAVNDSPLLWQTGTKPPLSSTESNKIISEDGQDIWVETDCGANGDCTSGGNEAHLMVYNSTLCTDPGNPWLDTVTGRCRNDIQTPVATSIADLEARVTALETAQSE